MKFCDRLRLKCDGTRAETRFRFSAKRTSPFKTARASVQSTTGSRGVRISGSNAGYTMFRGSVKSTGYPLHSPVSPSFPLPRVTVCHYISTGLYYRDIRLTRLTRTTKNPKAAGSNSNLGPPAHETGGLITQPWRSVKNIQTNDRQVRWRRGTFGFSRRTKFRCQLNKQRTQAYRRVTNWLLNRHTHTKPPIFLWQVAALTANSTPLPVSKGHP